MALPQGSRLGHFEITSALGAGGMGEVYKARDTRLNRTVAIKVLPPHIAADPQSRERFEREARAISALNHPRICTLHDIGRHDEIDYLVIWRSAVTSRPSGVPWLVGGYTRMSAFAG